MSENYAIISLGGKQYRVREGERLLVDRLPHAEGKTFHPDLLLLAGEGEAKIGADALKGQQVTARVASHVLGEKIIVGKHRRRTGYRRRNGHRSRLSQIEIEAIGMRRTPSSTPHTRGSTPSSTPQRKTRKKSKERK